MRVVPFWAVGKWVVVEKGAFTSLGLPEFRASFRTKAEATAWLRQHEPNAAARRNRYEIRSTQ